MRCPDCNKFAAFEEADPEVEDIGVEQSAVTAHVRITNNCADCSLELKEATLEMDSDVIEELSQHEEQEGHTLTVEEDESERTMRVEGKGRGAKTFYGARLTYTVKCEKEGCDFEHSGELTDDVQASAMEEVA
jgi:peptide subunit release factor 1 (eRF1)